MTKCSDCSFLISEGFPPDAHRVSDLAFRCSKKKYDTALLDGTVAPRYFSWGGIVKPNQAARASQADCELYEANK